MTIKIEGLEALQRELEDAKRAFESLNGTFTTLAFNPDEPGSVEDAVRQMEAAIDGKITPYRNNALVTNLAEKMKAAYREKILEHAKGAKA